MNFKIDSGHSLLIFKVAYSRWRSMKDQYCGRWVTMQKKFPDYINKINSNRECEQEIDLIVKNKIDFIVPIQTLNLNRSAVQQEMFTMSLNLLADHSHLNGEALSSIYHSTYKLIIPNNLKNQFLSYLRVLNITASSVFPDFDGLGKSLDEFVRLNVWRDNNQEGLEKVN